MGYREMIWTWIVLMVVFVIIEISTMGLATIWFAIAALVALVIAIADGSPTLQVIMFLIVSVLLLLTTRPIAKKYLHLGKEKTNIDSIKQAIGVVVDPICLLSYGTVKVSGNIWTAATKKDETFRPGERIQVVDVEGVKLIVEKIQEV